MRSKIRGRPQSRFRGVFVEQLEDRSLLAAIFAVNSVLDTDSRDSALTLREAILINNHTLPLNSLTSDELAQVSGTPTDSDTDTIAFNIPGNGVQTISPTKGLPVITDPVVIDGYTQPLAKPNTNGPDGPNNAELLIQLSGQLYPTHLPAILITAGGSTVRGLAIDNFGIGNVNGHSIVLQSGGGNQIEGNFIGTNPAGTTACQFCYGMGVKIADSANNIIGGSSIGAGNIISGNRYGIDVRGPASSKNVIQGNFIGTDASGTVALGNVDIGIYMTGPDNLIGGTVPEAQNVISGNSRNGPSFNVAIGAPSLAQANVVQGNYIGTDRTGTVAMGMQASGINAGNTIIRGNVISGNPRAGVQVYGPVIVQDNRIGTTADGIGPLGNSGAGILLADNIEVDGSNTLIGGTSAGEGNVIAFNSSGVVSSAEETTRVTILGNAIYSNGLLGIDLGRTGATANDTGDADNGSNNLQNFPLISYATRDAGKLKFTYTVPSVPANSTYPLRVEFFLADPRGQGKTYLGFDTFTEADFNAGGKTADFATNSPLKVFDKIVATATDSLVAAANSPLANTSEFSAKATILSPWLNPGGLRWDINDDGSVSADDVLAIINFINAAGSGLLPDGAANEKPYYDVDGDNNVAPADVIDVINYINAGRQLGGEAEGESEEVVGASASVSGDVIALVAMDVASQAGRRRRG